MIKNVPLAIVGSLIFWQFGCGDGTVRPSPPGTPGAPCTPSANISISPQSATVGSPDLTLTIQAVNNFTFHNGIWQSLVLWTQDGVDTPLQASFVNSSQLAAIVPAALLASPVTATIRVEIWDGI